jgi:hypothetical protein
MRALAVCSALLWLLAGEGAVANGRSRRRQCNRECGAAVQTCVTTGHKRKACRRRTLKACLRKGLRVCEVSTTTTFPETTTTVTTTTNPGSNRISPSGAWRFTGDADTDTCAGAKEARGLLAQFSGSAAAPAHADLRFALLPAGSIQGSGCELDAATQLLTCRDDFTGVAGATGLVADSTFEGGLGSYLAFHWRTGAVPPFGAATPTSTVCSGIGTPDQCCARWEFDARRLDSCSATTGQCTPQGDFSDGSSVLTFTVGCVDATSPAPQVCNESATFCGCTMRWPGKVARADVVG